MTLEEQIKEATPLGETYQHDCPGGWTAYAGKSLSGSTRVQYVRANEDQVHHKAAQSCAHAKSMEG